MRMAKQRETSLAFVLLTIFVAAAFGFTLFVNALAGIGPEAPLPWFPESIGDVSDKLTTGITPADFTFAIWGLIYIWQGGWITYVLTMLCRTNRDGDPLYVYPPVISTTLLSLYMLNLICNSLWCFVFCYEILFWQMAVLFLCAITLYKAIGDVCKLVVEYYKPMSIQYRFHLIFIYILVQNGLALYAAWVTVASMISLNIYLIYSLGFQLQTAATISLIILNGLIVIYFLLENTSWEVYVRYIYTPWLVFTWALVGSIAANWDPENINSLLTAFLLAFVVLALLIKVVLVPIRAKDTLRWKTLNH